MPEMTNRTTRLTILLLLLLTLLPTAFEMGSYANDAAAAKAEAGAPDGESTNNSAIFYATLLTVAASMIALALATIAFVQVSRAIRSIAEVRGDILEADDRQKLVEAAEKIAALEARLQGVESKDDSTGRLKAFEAKVSQAAAQVENVERELSKTSGDIEQANSRMDVAEKDIESLKEFKAAVQSARSRILDAVSFMQTVSDAKVGEAAERASLSPEEIPTETQEEQNQENETDKSEEANPPGFGTYHYPG